MKLFRNFTRHHLITPEVTMLLHPQTAETVCGKSIVRSLGLVDQPAWLVCFNLLGVVLQANNIC